MCKRVSTTITSKETCDSKKKQRQSDSMGSTSGLVVSELDSQSKGCGFESRLIQILDGNELKAMPG
jgi:hypothetical protein